MSKETFYFSHDYHARKDPKCQALICEYGISAYGLYWSLIEIMHEQGGKIKKFPKLYDGLAYDFRIDREVLAKQIEAMLHDFELLLQDDNYIWSERVLLNLREREAKKMLRVEAGKLGGIKSGISRLNRSKTKQCLKQNEANEPKKRKEKEIKEKNIFKIPTIVEIKQHCQDHNKKVDAEHFFNFYESKGWFVGKNKMKSWTAAINTWDKNNNGGNEDGSTNGYKKSTGQVRGNFTTERERNNAAACEEADAITREYYAKLAAAGETGTETG